MRGAGMRAAAPRLLPQPLPRPTAGHVPVLWFSGQPIPHDTNQDMGQRRHVKSKCYAPHPLGEPTSRQ